MRITKRRSTIKHRKRDVKKKPKKNKGRNSNIKNQCLGTDHGKIKTISKRVNDFFEKANLDEIAKKTGYLIRSSKITPFIFLYAMSMGLFGNEISLNMLAYKHE